MILRKLNSSSFNKTDFSLALLAEDPNVWVVPAYIAKGLEWLEEQIAPPASEDDGDDEAPELADPVEEVAAIVVAVAGGEEVA